MHRHHPGFNGGLVSTPNLDRLAEQGTSLSQFYVHSVCSPTRAAFLTGRYPFRNGMEERSHGNDVAGMLRDERTMAEALNEAGYYTGIIGKWHLGNWDKSHLPMQRGFDYQYGLYGALISYYDKTRAQFYDWHRNEQTLRQEGYSTDLIADEFVKLLESYDKDKPFFVYVPFNAVHGPFEAPADLSLKYEELIRDFSGRETGYEFKNGDALKFAMLESMDIAVGRMLDALEEKGFLENTLVLFFNDNGGPRYNPPYRGGKKENYEGGVRVPCILSWPGHIPEGKTVDEMIHVTDLYPTILNLVGASLKQKHPLDGMNMWETIVKGKKSPRTELVHSLPGNDFSDMGTKSIRQGPYKLVGEELYNIEKDPSETVDIAKEYPEVLETLHRRIDELIVERRTPEVHTKITETIREPLLVFGEDENANPPEWLAPYLKELSKGK